MTPSLSRSTVPLKRLIASIDSGVSVNAVDSPAERGQLGVLKTSCVYTGRFEPAENKTVVPEEQTRVSCPVKANTLVVSRMNTPDLVGAAGLVAHDEPNLYLPDRLWQVSFDRLRADPRFVHWWTQSAMYRDQVRVACAGTSSSMQNLDQDSFRSFAIPRFELALQAHVANFLDQQTARIDALIAEKERLQSALGCYEEAQISALLTYGCRSAELVDTGKPFVTKAPRAWKVVPFKRALVGMEQGWSPQCESRPAEAGEWGVLKVGCVNGGAFRPSENKALPPELQPDLSCLVRDGDVLVSRANTLALVGSAAMVRGGDTNLLLCDKLYRLKLQPGVVDSEYAVLLLRASSSRQQIELGASGASSSMQNIAQDVIRELIVALPSLGEQKDIVAAAYRVQRACEDLRSHVEQHLERLREYRSSLITAAVTGQLDISTFKLAA